MPHHLTALPPLVIDMNIREAQCFLCGDWTEYLWGVPTFNGDLVSNDFPDNLWHSGGGSQAVCQRCFGQHERGELVVYDRFYLHLAGGLIGGDGI